MVLFTKPQQPGWQSGCPSGWQLGLLIAVFTIGCQSRSAAIEALCNAPRDCQECLQAQPAMQSRLIAEHVTRKVSHREIRQAFDALAHAAPAQRGDLLVELATEAGKQDCALAEFYREQEAGAAESASLESASLEGADRGGETAQARRQPIKTAAETAPEPDRRGPAAQPTASGSAGAITFQPGPCTMEEPARLGETTARRPSVAIAYDSAGGLLAWSTDSSRVVAARIGVDGTANEPSEPFALPGSPNFSQKVSSSEHAFPVSRNSEGLTGLYRVENHFLLVSHSLCPEGRYAEKCLFIQAINPDGTAVGTPLRHQTGEWAHGQVRVVGNRLLMLRSHTYLPPALEQFQVGSDGAIRHQTVADVSHGAVRGEDQAAGLALVVNDDEPLVWIAHSPSEGATRHYLHFGNGASVRIRDRLPDDLRVAALTPDGELIRGLLWYQNRQFAVAIDRDGTLQEGPTAVPRDETVGGPVVPVLSIHQRKFVFGIARAHRRYLDPPIELDDVEGVAADGQAGRYLIASIDSGRGPRAVKLRRVSCLRTGDS